jgi:hypothetical protein
MRFPTAWASIASQNVTLKTAVLAMSLCLMFLGVATTKLAMKPPLIIDRACYSGAVSASSAKHTQMEIESFLREALAQRFNTEAVVKEGFLSTDETKFRAQEQTDLKRKEMSQKVIFNSPAKVEGSVLTVDTDRLISIAKVRSAFSFPIMVTISDTPRTESNPYGLIIEKIVSVVNGGPGDKNGK